MLNNYIGGGQVFLHKVRMLRQVLGTTMIVALFVGIGLAWSFNTSSAKQQVDWDGAITYAKARLAVVAHPALSLIAIGKSKANVDAYSYGRVWKKRMLTSSVLTSNRFQTAWVNALEVLKLLAIKSSLFGISAGFVVFLLWSRFGRGLKSEKKKEGSGVVLTPEQVRSKLKSLGQCSDFHIGKMPLVKDMETRHFLVTGATGSGKTNLIHNLLPQVEQKKQPAIVIDQTGEMIAKYYNKERGDIIFNPFDLRGSNWDFWTDCKAHEDLETFAQILIGFNSRKNNHSSGSNDFWESSAVSIFVDCAQVMQARNKLSIRELMQMIAGSDNEQLAFLLQSKPSVKYFSKDNAKTVASMLSVLMTNIKPLRFLQDGTSDNSFSMQQHFKNIQDGSDAWLFLATKPSNRQLTLPLIACLTELAMMRLMNLGIDAKRKVWFVIDELPALGRLPSLTTLMAEGRKYGACVLAGMQSLNQLYSGYGHYDGSTIFGQFGTLFFFRNTEPSIAKMVSSMCGTETITRQQKNTSFGANEFRDGVSYNEQQQKKALIEVDDLAALSTGQCYVLLPEPKVRLAKIRTKEVLVPTKQPGFIAGSLSAVGSGATRITEATNVQIKQQKQFKDESETEDDEETTISLKTNDDGLEINHK